MSKPIKLFYLVSPNFGYTFGGQTPIILETLNKWQEHKIEIKIIGSNFNTKDISYLFNTPSKNTKIRRIKWTIETFIKLIKRKNEYDLVEVHTQWWGGLLTPILVHCMRKKAIYVMTLYGSDNPSAVYSEKLGKVKLWLFKKFDGVIGLSPALIDDCKKHGFKSELLLLPNFLSFDPLAIESGKTKEQLKSSNNIAPNAKVLLFVGSTIYRKGFDLLIDCFINLSKSREDLYLVIVGANSKNENPGIDEKFVYAQKFKIAQEGLTDKVIWIGLVREQGLMSIYYQISDIFLFPSRAEGQGNVIVEAMAARLPVITSRLDGVTDMMIDPDVNGFLVEIDNTKEFIEKSEHLLDSAELRATVGVKARSTVFGQFDFQTFEDNLTKFYQKIFTLPR